MAGAFKFDEKILELRGLGLTRPEIAERLGICMVTVTNCMRRYGLVSKRRKKYKSSAHTDGFKRKSAFSIMIVGDNEVIKVLPTSKQQSKDLLALLQREGGEVI